MKNNPEAIAEVQDIIDASKCEQLGVVLLAKTEILDKLIEDSLSDKTKPKDRLAIYLKLNELVNSLTQSLQIDKENERRAREFLAQRPRISLQKSRFSATKTTITIKNEALVGNICAE